MSGTRGSPNHQLKGLVTTYYVVRTTWHVASSCIVALTIPEKLIILKSFSAHYLTSCAPFLLILTNYLTSRKGKEGKGKAVY